MRLRPILRLVTAAAVLAGCATRFVNTWQSPDWKGPPLRSVLVVGNAQDAAARRTYEDAMCARLAKIGVRAEPSYRLMPGEKIEREAIERTVAAGGQHGLIGARLIGVDERARYVPASPGPVPGPYVGWRSWDGFYEPGRVEIDRVARIETQAWSLVGEGTMVWAGSSETVNPREIASLASSLADATVAALQKAGVLPRD